jgi:hypothetical protein
MNPGRRFIAALLGAAASLSAAPPALAMQHLVSPGQNWQALAPKVKPGDEIILMPGAHRPAVFTSLRGTINKPITIRGLDREHPAEIAAEHEGLAFHRAQHVILQDLTITGAKISGLVFDDLGEDGASPSGFNDQIVLRRVSVIRTGPRGERHAITLAGVRGAFLDGCRAEGWGGSAVEIVGCRGVEIENCLFKGLDDHTQDCGIRARAGSVEIRIDRCRFEQGGVTAVSLGAISRIEDFRPPIPVDATSASIPEVARSQVTRCLIVDSQCAVAFVSSDDSLVRANTIIRPRQYVLWLTGSSADPRIARARRGVFGDNLVVWTAEDLEQLARVDDAANPESFVMEQNLWWSPDLASRREKLGTLPGEMAFQQIMDVDPRLDERFRTGASVARAFGAFME